MDPHQKDQEEVPPAYDQGTPTPSGGASAPQQYQDQQQQQHAQQELQQYPQYAPYPQYPQQQQAPSPQQYQQQPQQYQQQPPKQYQQHHPQPVIIYPTMSLQATFASDEAQYPKSAKLYNEMAAKFGPNANIVAPPDWLTSDKARVHWLKRDQNSLLYFLHKKEKYKVTMQELLDKPLCAHCCDAYPKAGQYDEQPGGMFCFMECAGGCCCCCSWTASNILRSYLDPTFIVNPSSGGTYVSLK